MVILSCRKKGQGRNKQFVAAYQALIFRLTRHLKIALINKIKTYYFSNLKNQQRITVKFPCERVNEKYSRFSKISKKPKFR